jgi:hypothetical protein
MRRRFKQVATLQERLAEFERTIRERAAALPDGKEKDALLKRLKSADTASRLDQQLGRKE